MVQIKGPISGYLFPHRAIIVELENLEKFSANLSTRAEISEFEKRVNFLYTVFTAHEDGEEAALYPISEQVRKGLSKPFEWDRQLNEKLFEDIFKAIAEYKKGENQVQAALKIAQSTAALKAFLGAHEIKEDEILLPLIDAEIPPPEQAKIMGAAMSKFQPQSVEQVEKFLLERLSQLERVAFLRMIKQGGQPDTFRAVSKWTREVVSPEEWKELTEQVPELA